MFAAAMDQHPKTICYTVTFELVQTLTRDSDFCLALMSSCFVNAIQRPSFIMSSVESKIFIPENHLTTAE